MSGMRDGFDTATLEGRRGVAVMAVGFAFATKFALPARLFARAAALCSAALFRRRWAARGAPAGVITASGHFFWKGAR